MPACLITTFGSMVLARWSDGIVYVTVDSKPEVKALTLAEESSLLLTEDASGRWILTYKEDTAIKQRYSYRKGKEEPWPTS